jgi:hypothetical protein
MRRRRTRIVWLVLGGVALGALAVVATNYVMRLDQQAEEIGSVPLGRALHHGLDVLRWASTNAGSTGADSRQRPIA